MVQTLSIHVTGQVQGVFYRKSTRDKAQELGITGSVRNLPDGSVQIIASGEPGQLHQLVAWCKQGPPRARVSSVEVSTLEPRAFLQFTIER